MSRRGRRWSRYWSSALRVFEGNAFLNAPNPALYADNSFPGIGGGTPAIVFEYRLHR